MVGCWIGEAISGLVMRVIGDEMGVMGVFMHFWAFITWWASTSWYIQVKSKDRE